MKVFSPKIEVRLIKTARRSKVGGGLDAATRYQEFTAIDLTPFLMENAPVSVQQYIGGGAGTWSLALADRIMPDYKETLYGMIEPMDLVEIRMARSPHEYQGMSGGNSYKLPVVMRGFVSGVRRSRSMLDGQPQRTVQLSGHDYSKVLDILRIYYLNNSAIGDNIIGELKFFHKYAGLDQARIMDAKEFVELVLKVLLNPFINRLTVNANGDKVGAAVMHQLRPEVTIDGTVSPLSVSLFSDGSVQQFLSQFMDVGAFNEMFVDDREDSSVLVVRPNHFLDLADQPIQGGGKASEAIADGIIDIADEDIESMTEERTDSSVANYYWVSNSNWQYVENITIKQLASAAPAAEYALFDYVNTNPARYGFRKMEVGTSMGPADQTYGDAAQDAQAASETDKRIKWLSNRRKILAQQNRDNAVLESGQMVVKGNERIKRGMYVRLTYGDFSALYYVTSVFHQYTPFHSFKTIISFERGTGFVQRARRANAAYLAEMNLKGAL